MERQLRDALEEVMKEIKSWAEDDYESGHPLDQNDFSEFKRVLDEDGVSLNRLLFKYYFECFENAKNN